MDAAGEHVGDDLRAAGVGDMRDLHLRQRLVQLKREMGRTAGAGGAERQRVRLFLGECGQFLDALHAKLGITVSTVGVEVINAIGAKSFMMSKFRLGFIAALIMLAAEETNSV